MVNTNRFNKIRLNSNAQYPHGYHLTGRHGKSDLTAAPQLGRTVGSSPASLPMLGCAAGVGAVLFPRVCLLWRGVPVTVLFPSPCRRKSWQGCAPEGQLGVCVWGGAFSLAFVGFVGWAFFLPERGEFLMNDKLKRGRKGHLCKEMFTLQLSSNLCWVIY